MRFCFLNLPIEFYSPVSGGAISTIIAETASALEYRGHQVTVLTPVNGDPLHPVGTVVPIETKARNDLGFVGRRISGVRRRLKRWDWPYYEYYLSSLTRVLKRTTPTPDVVVLFNDLFTPPTVRALLPSARVMVWLQNEWTTHPSNRQRTVEATDRFLTCSTYIKNWTIQHLGLGANRLSVVPSGVNTSTFRPRDSFRDPPARTRLLFLGRIDRNKGPDLMLDAVESLKDEGLNVDATVAGGLWFYGKTDPMSDPYFRSLRAKMDETGTAYLGHVSRADVPSLVRAHDVVCVLSRSNEPFGLVALEAMASGCAVVASDRGGLPEACGSAGVLVNPDDGRSILGAIRSLIVDPLRLSELKRACVARASAATWMASATRLEAIAAELR